MAWASMYPLKLCFRLFGYFAPSEPSSILFLFLDLVWITDTSTKIAITAATTVHTPNATSWLQVQLADN